MSNRRSSHKRLVDQLADQILELTRIICEQQALLATLCAYQLEQPTFDPVRFGVLLEAEREQLRLPKMGIADDIL